MNLEALELLMPPPPVPYEAPKGEDWFSVETKLNTHLPQDYKRFMERYGSGRIDEFLSILNPVSTNKYRNLFFQIEMQLNALKELREGGTEIVPFELFPVTGGLLPFGLTENEDVLYWQTVGHSDNWTVVVNEGRSPEWAMFQVGIVEFLCWILERQISCNIFQNDFPSSTPLFISSTH